MDGDALSALQPVLPEPRALFPTWLAGVETERLRLLPLGPDFADAWRALHLDASVVKYLYGPAMTAPDCWRDLAFAIGHAHLRGFSMWAVCDRQDGRFLGRVGPWMPDGWPGLEIGWAFMPDSQGQGYATEAAKAVLDWAARHLPGAATAIHSIHPDNLPSQTLAQRLGAQQLGDATISDQLYQIWVSDLGVRRAA